MRRYRITATSVLFLILVTLLGCPEMEEADVTAPAPPATPPAGSPPRAFTCPLCDAKINWTSYGDLVFTKAGSDATARRLVTECGWQIYAGHNGGIGDTLQVGACGDHGVVLAWAFNEFHACRLAEGWQGKTEEGIGFGASVAEFLAAYPTFTQTSPTTYRPSTADAQVAATFDPRGTLKELIVGHFFRR